MTIEKGYALLERLAIQEDAAFALRLALHGILGQIAAMRKEAGNCDTIGTQSDFARLEAEIATALSRHGEATQKHGTNPLSHIEQGWQEWKKTKPKVKSFRDLPH
jgi:hypothetical protein